MLPTHIENDEAALRLALLCCVLHALFLLSFHQRLSSLICHMPHRSYGGPRLFVKHNLPSHGAGLVEDVRGAIQKVRDSRHLRRVVVQQLVQQVRPAAKRLADPGRPNQHVRLRTEHGVVVGPPRHLTSHNVPHAHHLAAHKHVTLFTVLKPSVRPAHRRRQHKQLEPVTARITHILRWLWCRRDVNLSIRPNARRKAISHTHAKRLLCHARQHVAPPRIHHGLEGTRNNLRRFAIGLSNFPPCLSVLRSIKRNIQKTTHFVPQPFIRQLVSHCALGVRIFVRTAPLKETRYSFFFKQWDSPVNKRVRLTLRKAQDHLTQVIVRDEALWSLDHDVHPHVTVNICSTMANTLKTLAQQHLLRWSSTIQQHILHTAVQRPQRARHALHTRPRQGRLSRTPTLIR
ncbi:retrotransposon hot spot (RHS) protein, putative [Trypanosoma vivax Y486]|uniref:Retrotransposon hot spot (RHS) protein, putative n=1 Tax=Trypanosoma vivax (strain Y486) TaxID=1055687 RepID=F9WL15_TRYVY|nr:retrotransposon hot spot (RHS) protein, putative [Trypanosoma vivax Y486]|eukprot:CCD18200.1 retrotransposon hot spot (RHS) protein, putative [Trypanosoma vivax Y486]